MKEKFSEKRIRKRQRTFLKTFLRRMWEEVRGKSEAKFVSEIVRKKRMNQKSQRPRTFKTLGVINRKGGWQVEKIKMWSQTRCETPTKRGGGGTKGQVYFFCPGEM